MIKLFLWFAFVLPCYIIYYVIVGFIYLFVIIINFFIMISNFFFKQRYNKVNYNTNINIPVMNSEINIDLKNKSPIKNAEYQKEKFELEQLDVQDYRDMAKKIQNIYYDLGYQTQVVDIKTYSRYSTTYKIIFNKDDDIMSVSSKVLERIGIENCRILPDKEKYIKIIIPLMYEKVD